MGSPKALLEWNGETVLERMIGLIGAAADPVIVVVGFHAETIPPTARATRVVNPAPERGMLSSLQCGLRAVPEECEAVLFTPVDYPAVTVETVRALAAVRAPVAIPVFEGRRGHPVLVSRPVAREILALPEDARASDVIRRYLDRAIMVEVNDRGVVEDIDDPATYQRLRRQAGEA